MIAIWLFCSLIDNRAPFILLLLAVQRYNIQYFTWPTLIKINISISININKKCCRRMQQYFYNAVKAFQAFTGNLKLSLTPRHKRASAEQVMMILHDIITFEKWKLSWWFIWNLNHEWKKKLITKNKLLL